MTLAVNTLARGLLVQAQVVHALILRETRTRFGKHQMGYMWALVGPLAIVALFGGMMSFAGRTSPLGGNVVTFVATGFLPFLFFRSIYSRCSSAVSSNLALLFYPQVKPFDLILARTGLEFATHGVSFVAILGGIALWDQELQIDSSLRVVTGFVLIGGIGVGIGLILCAATTLSPSVEKIVPLIMRPLLWVSGIFFTANELPMRLREVMLFNPLLHCIELVRDGWFLSYTAHYVSIKYPLFCCIGLLFVGMISERVARGRVGST